MFKSSPLVRAENIKTVRGGGGGGGGGENRGGRAGRVRGPGEGGGDRRWGRGWGEKRSRKKSTILSEKLKGKQQAGFRLPMVFISHS